MNAMRLVIFPELSQLSRKSEIEEIKSVPYTPGYGYRNSSILLSLLSTLTIPWARFMSWRDDKNNKRPFAARVGSLTHLTGSCKTFGGG